MAYYSNLTDAQIAALEKSMNETLNEQVQALSTIVQIPSVKAEAAECAPFGKPIQSVLYKTLDMARKMGFEARDLDGYAGIISYAQGEETLGVLAHLDVVPAGAGWSIAPFGGDVIDGYIYGRGTTDNKGPALNALYALYAIKEIGIPLKRRVEIILGLDEESDWECMHYYKQKEKMPDIAFSPDGEYPLVYSEKAIAQAHYKVKLNASRLRIFCGERTNVVPGEAEAFVYVPLPPAFELPAGYRAEVTQEEGGTRLKVAGLGAHASMPHLGKNALLALLHILAKLPLDEQDKNIICALHDAFRFDLHGETLGLDIEDESGRLTLNPAILQWTADEAVFAYDARIPHSLEADRLFEATDAALFKGGLTAYKRGAKAGHHVPLESPLVQRLMGVYRAQTGDMEAAPLAIGGGTYARAMPVAVAFGCEFPNEVSRAHMPDERVSIERTLFNTRVMADAILALAGAQD